jgi:hypothetical protein
MREPITARHENLNRKLEMKVTGLLLCAGNEETYATDRMSKPLYIHLDRSRLRGLLTVAVR